jgi:hypothetical protein
MKDGREYSVGFVFPLHACHGLLGKGGYRMTTFETLTIVISIIGLLFVAYKMGSDRNKD